MYSAVIMKINFLNKKEQGGEGFNYKEKTSEKEVLEKAIVDNTKLTKTETMFACAIVLFHLFLIGLVLFALFYMLKLIFNFLKDYLLDPFYIIIALLLIIIFILIKKRDS